MTTAEDGLADLEAELARRNAILEAVRLAAERFLDPTTSWEQRLPDVLATLARATDTSRVYLFEAYRHDADGEVWVTQRFEWSAPGVRSIADEPHLAELPLRGAGVGRWLDILQEGGILAGLRGDMLPSEREQLDEDETLSIALVPIFVEERLWGMLGFDECAYERVWSAGELNGLRAAAETIAAAIHADRAATLLRAREAEYRAVFEATGDGLAICDGEGRLVAANPAFCTMHGEELSTMEQQPATQWVHPDYHELAAEFLRLVTTGEAFAAEAVDVRRDGSSFPVEVRGSRLQFRGQPHALLVVRDVTERARMRALLEHRLRGLSAVAESLTLDQPLGDMLAGLCRIVVETTDAVAATVQLIDGHTDAVRVLAQHGHPDGYAERLEAVSRTKATSPVTAALREQRVRLLQDARTAALALPAWAPLHELLAQATWSDVLVVPLDALGRSVGSLNLYYPGGSNPDDAERSFFRTIADQAATAVENAQLFEAAQGAAVLEERQRLARELHDSVSQALYGIALGARTARTLLDQEPQRAREPMDYVLQLSEAGLAEMRALIFELRPEVLATEGIVDALQRQLEAVRVRHHLEVTDDLGSEPDVRLDVKEAIYRVTREALNNVIKHAAAQHVEVSLADDEHALRLSVTDDGAGFDPERAYPGHLGLESMRERSEGVGGSFELTSSRGGGTTVTVVVPHAPV